MYYIPVSLNENIWQRSVLWVEETRVSKENHPSAITDKLYHPSAITNKLYHPSSITDKLYHPSAITDKLYHPSAITHKLYHPSAITHKLYHMRLYKVSFATNRNQCKFIYHMIMSMWPIYESFQMINDYLIVQ